jgi:hypothetical protein
MHSDTINIIVVPTSNNKFDLKITTLDDKPLEEYKDLSLDTMDYTINTKSAYVRVVQPDLIGEKSC